MKKGFYTVLLALLWIPHPASAQRAVDSPYTFADFIEPDFPFITTTVNAGILGPMYTGRNLAARCLILQLGNEAHACFDTDLLRVAATWTGASISMLSMPQVSYHKAGNKRNGIPEILGNPVTATGIYPGWQGEAPSFVDPRPAGPNPAEMGRGPIDPALGKWLGVSVHGSSAVLRYTVKNTRIAEMMSSATSGGHTGIVRTLQLDPHTQPLTVVLGEFKEIRRHREDHDHLIIHHDEGPDQTILGLSGDAHGAKISLHNDQYAVLEIPSSKKTVTLHVLMWKGRKQAYPSFKQMLTSPMPAIPNVSKGGPAHWGAPATTTGHLGDAQGAFAIDDLTLPLPNRWKRNVRVGGLDFFSDGRAAVSTFEGDVWLVSGIDENLGRLTWKRYASGISEPMSLSIVRDTVYVFGREGIVRFHDLNGDDEADYYENFSNLPVQTGESREYPLSMHALSDGGFLIAKNAALDAGPKTNPNIVDGFRAGGPHSGSVLKISADGQQIEVFASGFRAPYTSLHPGGWITASDQQGHSVPSTPVYLVQQDKYYGVPATVHRDIIPEATKPITWIPHQVDRSGTEQVWITGDRMGPLSNTLVHLSYGKPGIYRVYIDDTFQGGIAEIPLTFPGPLMKGKMHPRDGLLYVAGFQVWDSDAPSTSRFSRVRYTGGALPLPARFEAGRQGVLLHFEQRLDPAAADPASYTLERWNYKRTAEYGSGHFKPSGEPGHESVPVAAASLSGDYHDVFLQIDDMEEVMQMGVSYNLLSDAGDSLSHTVYFTINQLPELNLAEKGFSDPVPQINVQTSKSNPSAGGEITPTPARGKQIYTQMGCIACHSSDGSTEGRSGPTFKALYGSTRSFNDGTSSVADEAYLIESMLNPSARVVAGKEVEMPSYLGILSESDVASVILYIKSINP